MKTVQERGTTSRKQHQVSSQFLVGHQQWHRAPHLGTGWRNVCNKHFPLAPATAKLQAKVVGVSRTREG